MAASVRVGRLWIGAAGLIAFPSLALAQSVGAPSPPVRLGSPPAALPYDEGATGLALAIKRLSTRASMIAIVAHPDDEDGGLLTFESRGRGTRTALMTLNRGEGGENAMGADFGEALGLIRSQELLRAGQYYGADQYWGHVIDYGFSKTPEEALKHWGDDRALADVVRVIRKTRPLVVTSSFVGAPTDGHGHHQIAGISAQRAFTLAADPNAFPDQIASEGLPPWRALKVYGRSPFARITDKGMYDYATGKYLPVRFTNHVDGSVIEGKLSTDLEVPTGTQSPMAGKSYAQIAREGLSLHKSQIASIGPLLPGQATSGYHRFASFIPTPASEADMFAGIDVSLPGIADLAPKGQRKAIRRDLAPLARLVADIDRTFDVAQPQSIAPALAKGMKLVRAIVAKVKAGDLPPAAKYDVVFELRTKERQFADALAQALGVVAVATLAPEGAPDDPMAAMGFGNPRGAEPRTITRDQDVWVKFQLVSQSSEPLAISDIRLGGVDQRAWNAGTIGDAPTELGANVPVVIKLRARVPADQPFTRAAYYRPAAEAGWYEVDGVAARNRSYLPFPLIASATLRYRGEDIRIDRTVEGTETSKTGGTMPVPTLVEPALAVAVTAERKAIPLEGGKTAFTLTVRNNAAVALTGIGRLAVPAGWTATPAQQAFHVDPRGGTQQLTFNVTTNGTVGPARYAIKASVESDGKRFDEGYSLIGYDGLATYPLFAPAVEAVTAVDVHLPKNLKIAYVTGTGDVLPATLTGLGVTVDQLSAEQVAANDFAQYDAVVLGIGAYGKRPELTASNKKLRAYVEDGGVAIVQGSVGWSSALAPYPVVLGDTSTEVTEEDAKVKVLRPDSSLLTWPNKIVASDFDGWVEQRGDGFLREWDAKYNPILAMNDTDQDVQRGGLLDLPLGKGHFIYSALAFYRQVPAGVPGAIRLLANLVSQKRKGAPE